MPALFIRLVAVGLLYIAVRHVFTPHDQLLSTLETTTSSFGIIVINICFPHVYSINTDRTTLKHTHVNHVNRGCPRGHMVIVRKNALWRNLHGESKRRTWHI